MNFLESVAMAVVQGLTEFLPVSSSGHLALASRILEVPQGGIEFEIVLHLGTLLAVLVFYWKDLTGMVTGIFRGDTGSIRLALLLMAATVPVAVVGLLAGDFIEGLFENTLFVSSALIATGLILFFFGRSTTVENSGVPAKKGMTVGLLQALALFPGISRSGITICTGLRAGLSREEAARFSFLLAIPAITGAAVKELPSAQWSMSPAVLASGFLVSAVVGLAALKILVGFVRKGGIRGFSWYCWAVGILGFTMSITAG